MAKQGRPITRQCQSRVQCCRDATVGLYGWAAGASDVNLDKPIRVFCGLHKLRLSPGYNLRNVRLRAR